MDIDTRHPTSWAPIVASSLVIVLAAMVGSSILTFVVAQDSNAGWTIWYYALVAAIPIVSSLALSGGAILVLSGLFRKWNRMSFGKGLGLVLSFLLVAYGIWTLTAAWLFSTSFVALPEVNAEAEDIFFRSWVEIEHRILIGAVFVAIALSAIMVRSATKYWAPISCVAAALGIWELGALISASF